MDARKKKRLEAAGWRVGSTQEFLGLSSAEATYIELKIALSDKLKERRQRRQVTQQELARLLGSSQSRVAKMEAGDPTVSLDLLLRALFALGATRRDVAKAIA
jgi:DNA-binding XRE family transcriptional regulator